MAAQSSSDMDTAEHTTQAKAKKSMPITIGGIVQPNREFLDFFWDIAKPDQEIRLAATENLINYLKSSTKEDELKYTLKRLVEGLAATRETSRPGFSLALAQVVQCFEDIALSTVLALILEKHNPERVKKKSVRHAAFGSFFGVLALFQSGRLSKDNEVLVRCVQLLQLLARYREHLKDLPRKTLVDILTEIPESTFEEVLFEVLHSDLTSAFNTPEQLHLLLVGMQKFPAVLKPKKLKKLLGSSTITTEENIPKLLDLLKTAAKSVKKEHCLPGVALDLMQMSLKEQAFELFWKEVVENGLLKEESSGPCTYMCYRLLGASLPFLDISQLQVVLRSEVMLHYGAHVVSTQPADRFKFSPEMETYVDSFLAECTDPEKQVAVLTGFTLLTNQGYPVVPSVWKVIRHLQPAALQTYIDWLKDMFVQPDMSTRLDFSTKRQKENQEQEKSMDYFVFRLRKWIIPRLVSIVENTLVKRSEEQVMDIARFVFFHGFFESRKAVADIEETKSNLSIPLDENLRTLVVDAFFSLLFHLNCMVVVGDSPAAAQARQRQVVGVTADGTLWIKCMVDYANTLLSRGNVVTAVKPFTEEQKTAWNQMLQRVADLKKRAKQSQTMEASSYQQLLLLVGIHLFKTPEESMDILSDIKSCLDKAQSKKSKRKMNKDEDEQEPEWVEVMVEILLSLFSQPSRLFRLVARNVFKNICPYVTKNALQLILNVLDSEADDGEDAAVVVTEEKGNKTADDQMDEEESSSDEDSDGDEPEDEGNSDEEEEAAAENVNDDFRKQLMKVLQAGSAVDGEDSDEELDDDAMMAMDENLSSLFAEQQKRIQAKKDEKARIRKEKILRKDFKTKVLDLVEVFVKKQSESPLVFSVIEPLISTITKSMNSDSSNQQERDYLQKTASIFMNEICKAKKYCRDVSELKEDLHVMMERLVNGACKQNDSSVGLYYFSASLYLLKVLKNSTTDSTVHNDAKSCPKDEGFGCLDLPRVTGLYRDSLKNFMSKRKTSLTSSMFMDLFHRYPFMCKPMLDILVTSIKDGARPHQQGQACALVLKALQTADVKKAVSPSEWQDLIQETIQHVMQTLEAMNEIKAKVDQEKLIKCFELLNFLIKTVTQQKLSVNLTELHPVLHALSQNKGFGSSIRQRDMYWNVMKLIGVARPKQEKRKAVEDTPQNNAPPKKKKGFLPETKKRKNRKNTPAEHASNGPEANLESTEGEKQAFNSKKKRKNKKKSGQTEGTQVKSAGSIPNKTSPGPAPSKKARPSREANGPPGYKMSKKKAKNN